MSMLTAYIGLGSNLGDSQATLCQALIALQTLPETYLTRFSSFYRSKPIGPQDQADFLNAVAGIETALLPEQLLAGLQNIENEQGRERLQHWGPRTLDLDILLYGQQHIKTALLTVPHVELANRTFVLCPLLELAPELHLPNGLAVKDLLAKFDRNQYPMPITPDSGPLHDLRTTLLATPCPTSKNI